MRLKRTTIVPPSSISKDFKQLVVLGVCWMVGQLGKPRSGRAGMRGFVIIGKRRGDTDFLYRFRLQDFAEDVDAV